MEKKYFIFSVGNLGRFWKANRHGYTCFPGEFGLQVSETEFLRMKAEHHKPERWEILTEEMALEMSKNLDLMNRYDELAIEVGKPVFMYFLSSYCIVKVNNWFGLAEIELSQIKNQKG